MYNQVTVVGCIASDFEYSHNVLSEKFYSVVLAIERDSHKLDYIPLLVSERLIDVQKSYVGSYVAVKGGFRSHNQHDADKNRLKLYVFVNTIELLTDNNNVNDVYLEGYICKQPVYRHTPLGREIADIMLAVNRSYNKSDYIPCILWGRNAQYISTLNAGSCIRVAGRIQSRDYTKNNEVKTAYELSVSLLEVI